MDFTRQEHGTNIPDFSDLLQTPANDALGLTKEEQSILKLWDQEEEVRLEIHLLEAQKSYLSRLSPSELQDHITAAERALLEARTSYILRNRIITNVLIADPILQAVHPGSTATELETRLLPLINERDVLAMVHNTLCTQLHDQRNRLASLERENKNAIAENKSLAGKMVRLAKGLKSEKVEEVKDAKLRAQLEKLDEEVRKNRREWRVLKSLAGSIVTGSGVNWAKDPKLLELVMDEEDEMAD
ncbi:hypothetical protein EJ08DRAFT_718413 [Tothia fuscella]|uniref:Centromere protein H C-terminal domain-containing protein n=1 Tax=Tothia fuscella TaxID=1048955 RepID=A0A9P4NPA0_9PEZI|nr:hypothetical protein EJ08DRAFT_718413 [Tothia fuscella]